MLLPIVAPMNDSSMDNLARVLRDVRNNLSNLGSGNAAKVLEDYQRWASQSAHMLGYMFDHSALDYLILTRRHRWLMEASINETGPSVLNAFRAEQTDRQRVLDDLIREYDLITKRWGSTT